MHGWLRVGRDDIHGNCGRDHVDLHDFGREGFNGRRFEFSTSRFDEFDGNIDHSFAIQGLSRDKNREMFL